MQVSRYLFQSPSSQQVQIGRPDPSVQQDSASTGGASLPSEVVSKGQNFATVQVSDITPKVESSDSAPLLDVYA